jgi:hypothetical protein
MATLKKTEEKKTRLKKEETLSNYRMLTHMWGLVFPL